jgi:flagellar basal body-associated protein FliL
MKILLIILAIAVGIFLLTGLFFYLAWWGDKFTKRGK